MNIDIWYKIYGFLDRPSSACASSVSSTMYNIYKKIISIELGMFRDVLMIHGMNEVAIMDMISESLGSIYMVDHYILHVGTDIIIELIRRGMYRYLRHLRRHHTFLVDDMILRYVGKVEMYHTSMYKFCKEETGITEYQLVSNAVKYGNDLMVQGIDLDILNDTVKDMNMAGSIYTSSLIFNVPSIDLMTNAFVDTGSISTLYQILCSPECDHMKILSCMKYDLKYEELADLCFDIIYVSNVSSYVETCLLKLLLHCSLDKIKNLWYRIKSVSVTPMESILDISIHHLSISKLKYILSVMSEADKMTIEHISIPSVEVLDLLTESYGTDFVRSRDIYTSDYDVTRLVHGIKGDIDKKRKYRP